MERVARMIQVGEAAQRLGVSRSTVRRLIESGQLPAVRYAGGNFRIRPEDVEALLERSRLEALRLVKAL